MSSLHFPVKLYQTELTYVHLTVPNENYTESRVFFAQNNHEIIRFYENSSLIDTTGVQKGNLLYEITNVERNDEFLDIHITITPNKGFGLKSENTDFFIVENGYIKINESTKDKQHIRFTFEYKNYTGLLYLIYFTQQITNLNVDLGSDSTQVACYVPGNRTVQNCDLINIFNNTYRNRRYDLSYRHLLSQTDSADPGFYKTGSIGFKNQGVIDSLITSDVHFFNFLNGSHQYWDQSKMHNTPTETQTLEESFKHPLPNMKVGYVQENLRPNATYILHGVEHEINTGLKSDPVFIQIFNGLYKLILDQCINQIDNNKESFINLLLLVPNIYLQKHIELLAHNLALELNSEYIQSKFKNELNLKNSRVFQINMISESDAVLLGLKNRDDFRTTLMQHGLKPDKKGGHRFLILDSGKGTTDFSIIEMEDLSNYKSTHRGGIVGAGAVIDFLFLEIFTKILFDSMKYRKAFFQFMLTATMTSRSLVMKFIEKIKIDYSKTKTIPNLKLHFPDFVKSFKGWVDDGCNQNEVNDVKIGLLNELDLSISERTILPDEYVSEIQELCNTIIDKVFNDEILPKKHLKRISAIILTGRAFMFEPLLKALYSKIDSLNDERIHTSFLKKRPALKKAVNSIMKLFVQSIRIIEYRNNPVLMKKVAVGFPDNSALNVNCNTNLLRFKIHDQDHDNDFSIEEDNFVEGFKVSINRREETVHYIAYATDDGKIMQPFTKTEKADNISVPGSWYFRTVFPSIPLNQINNLEIEL